MRLDEIAYCRGFAMWKDRPCKVPSRYQTLQLPSGHTFAHDQVVETSLVTAPDGNWMVFSGAAVNVASGEARPGQLVRKLLAAFAVSEEAFFDGLDVLSGRFVIAYCLGGRVRVLHDACGTRSVFHSIGPEPIVASHLKLVADALGAGPSAIAVARLPYRYGYAGRGSPADGVVMLTPNCLLDLTTGLVRRYFPRGPVPRSNVADVVHGLIADVRRQLRAVVNRYPRVTASLTAGQDSRFTLATSFPFKRSIEYFTYRTSGCERQEMDASVALDIARRFKLRHHLIEVPRSLADLSEFIEFNRAMDLNTHYDHGRKIAYLYWKTFSAGPTVHLRSNLAEIGRAFYRKSGRPRPPLSGPEEMTKLFRPDLSGQALAEAAFADFFEATDFGSIYDYDPYDMFYWEHRMGMWHSLIAIESDPAFETYIVFNARCVLKAMLSLPLSERMRAAAFAHVVARCRPALSRFPVNPKDWRERYGAPVVVATPARRRRGTGRWPLKDIRSIGRLPHMRRQGGAAGAVVPRQTAEPPSTADVADPTQ
jgi:hypothetical protein